MLKRIVGIILVFLTWILAGVIEKVFFLVVNASSIGEYHLEDVAAIVGHGLRLDLAVAGYLTVVPAILLIVSLWVRHGILSKLWNAFTGLFALVFVFASCANVILYGYWGFPLDSTPIFYALSSPKDALASASIGLIVSAIILIVLLSGLLHSPFRRIFSWIAQTKISQGLAQKFGATFCLLLVTATLFIPIRGGFSVAVVNVGSVYFSDNVRINHAAVNPLFSVLESLSHDNDFASQYRFMEADEADRLFEEMTYTTMRDTESADSTSLLSHTFLNAMQGKDPTGGVRVYLVILESFSSYIMDGGEGNLTGITPELQQLITEGLYFSNFHSNSFRTDRGLVSILSGYPAQPTTSLMKYPHKTNGLYAIARSLASHGFITSYVYGGDANFTNMRSYLKATGFGKVISEEDYPAKDRTGKWGANDSVLFDKALAEKVDSDCLANIFCVVQTSSSHEPFDVPCHYLDNRPLNAFRYADVQLGRFVKALKSQSDWDRTLMVIVPDHVGCYPEPEPDGFDPYFNHIPMLMIGGAIPTAHEIPTIGSQQDIAATLLAMLGIDHSEFTFSKDLFDANAPHFAFFTFPDAVGMVTPSSHFMFDNRSRKMIYNVGKPAGADLHKAQAYLQCLFDDIAGR